MSLKDTKGENEVYEGLDGGTRPVGKPKNIRALVDAFPLDAKLSIVARAAHFFAYLAEKAPHQFCAPNLALKAVMGFAKCPRDMGEEVLSFRKRGSAIRQALATTYGRGFIVDKLLGWMRATVDDEDLARTQQVREVERIRSSVAAARRTNGLISVNKVRDPSVRSWLKGGVTPLLKALTEDDRIFRLMPGKKEDGDGSGE